MFGLPKSWLLGSGRMAFRGLQLQKDSFQLSLEVNWFCLFLGHLLLILGITSLPTIELVVARVGVEPTTPAASTLRSTTELSCQICCSKKFLISGRRFTAMESRAELLIH